MEPMQGFESLFDPLSSDEEEGNPPSPDATGSDGDDVADIALSSPGYVLVPATSTLWPLR